MIRRHLKGITFTFVILSAVLIGMAAPNAPSIISWGNDKTNNDSLDIQINVSESVRFNASANQTIDTWTWSINNNPTKTHSSTFTTSFTSENTYEVKVDANNTNGTSKPVIWSVHVITPVQKTLPIINYWFNNKTNNDLLNFKINVSEPVLFNVTADQPIDTWSWFINNNSKGINASTFITSFTSEEIYEVKVEAKNTNGTSLPIIWYVQVSIPPETPPRIDSWFNNRTNDNSRNFTINVSEPVLFNVTADQAIETWRWFINNIEKDNNFSHFITSFDTIGAYSVKVNATNSNGTSDPLVWNVRAIDTVPPANVTNLNAMPGQTYINWTWKNPTDTDFDGTRIYLDDSFKTNLPNTSNNYTAPGLAPNTSHKITVIAFDTSNNNATPIENISTTLPNTPKGDDVTPQGLPSGVNVTFNKVTEEGNTTVSFAKNSSVVPGFEPLGNYVNIYTSASFTGAVTVTLTSYEQPPEGYIENNVGLYLLLNNSIWENITTSLDTTSNIVTGKVTGQSPFILIAGVYPPPKIKVIQQPSGLDITVKDSLFFNISVDQTANVNWTVNNISQNSSLIQAGGSSSFNFSSTTKGNYSTMVEADNANGTSTRSWNVTVHPRFFFKGNRIWDGSKPDEFSLTYTWDPMSFSGFYYDINDDVGDESITITLDSYSDRNINRDDLVYTTTPQEVDFGYSGFGRYNVIGFMAEKYFAGYTANSRPPNPTTDIGAKSVLAQGQLHKVLMDDDTRRTISLGSTLTLQEGYVLKAVDIDLGARTMLISLLKDGTEVDRTPLSAGQTYVYTKRVGAVADLPVIMVRFDSVFSGTEVQAAFLRGMFQISESYDTVNTGNDFGMMEVASVSDNKIEMRNNAGISLSQGSTVDLMGDVKIIVADDSSAVRFALSVEKTGSFEVRSSIYREDDPIDEWTPYNFGMNIGKTSFGFYYDLDEGIGNESLSLAEPLDGGRTIKDGNLLYTTTPQEVNFGYSGFGSYEVIGFMAEKYFAGYTAGSRPPNPTTGIGTKSVLAQGQLHKVLIDDDTRRTISLGSTLTLQEGYVLKAVDIDLGARTMLISLLKDGTEVDSTPLSAGQTYVYTKRVGAVADLPVIMVRFDSVFSGTEVQAAFLRGVFQISENYATVSAGNEFGMMEVRSVSNDNIEMSNVGSIGLDNGENEVLMGNIKLKVGDTADNSLRFYFAVDVTPEMVANLLVIDTPAQANAGDTVEIKVTAGGGTVDGASLSIDSSEIGQTDANGTFDYTLPRTMKGIHNITATKLGYLKATKNIEVLEYIERRLSIDSPAKANQFETITTKVTSNSTAISGASVKFDNTTIGSTDINGTLNYMLETSGTHSISASKSGYITVIKEIDVRAPFSDYQALDINITPGVVFTDEKAVIRSNITNAGTKKDTLPVELIINGTAVDNRSVALAPAEIKEINFTRMEAKAGNYTVEILGQKGLLEVKQKPFTLILILIAMIFTGSGVIIIYLLTAKNKISLELIQRKLNVGKKPQ